MPDRTALVTGGAGGLGRSVVDALLADGWRVVVPVQRTGSDPQRAGLSTITADLTNPDDVARTVRAATDGAPLKALVNLVGGFAADQPVADTPLAEFELLFTRNLRPTYLMTQAVLPHLQSSGGGSIVCTGAAAALHPFAGAAGYTAAKAAVIAFAKAVAEEGRPDDVRCNVILPSLIDTPANREMMPEAEWHKLVPPERIASVIAFLCGDQSAALNGAALPV
jgi:NAD(P)-dependent dehydrogenase (short-subunit alcohol dehydrogenase family)